VVFINNGLVSLDSFWNPILTHIIPAGYGWVIAITARRGRLSRAYPCGSALWVWARRVNGSHRWLIVHRLDRRVISTTTAKNVLSFCTRVVITTHFFYRLMLFHAEPSIAIRAIHLPWLYPCRGVAWSLHKNFDRKCKNIY